MKSLWLRVDVVWTLEALVGLIWFNPYDPTFMLGIWCGRDWMKEIFWFRQSTVGWYVEVLNWLEITHVNMFYFSYCGL